MGLDPLNLKVVPKGVAEQDVEFETVVDEVLDDARQSLHGGVLGGGVVHEHAAGMASVSLANRVAHELIGRVIGAVTAGDVPVEIMVAGLVHLLDDSSAHSGVEVVDAAAGEAHKRRGVPDLLGNGVAALV